MRRGVCKPVKEVRRNGVEETQRVTVRGRWEIMHERGKGGKKGWEGKVMKGVTVEWIDTCSR